MKKAIIIICTLIGSIVYANENETNVKMMLMYQMQAYELTRESLGEDQTNLFYKTCSELGSLEERKAYVLNLLGQTNGQEFIRLQNETIVSHKRITIQGDELKNLFIQIIEERSEDDPGINWRKVWKWVKDLCDWNKLVTCLTSLCDGTMEDWKCYLACISLHCLSIANPDNSGGTTHH